MALDGSGDLGLWDLKRSLSAPVETAGAVTEQGGAAFGQELCFSPDGRFVVVLVENNDVSYAQLQLWAVSATEHLRLVSCLNWPTPGNIPFAMAFAPDGSELAFGDQGGGIRLVSVSPSGALSYRGPVVSATGSLIYSMSFNSAGDTLAATDGTDLWIWHDTDGVLTLEGDIPVDFAAGLSSDSAFFIPASHTLVSGGVGFGLDLWNLDPSVQAQSAWICSSTNGVLTRQNWASTSTHLTWRPVGTDRPAPSAACHPALTD